MKKYLAALGLCFGLVNSTIASPLIMGKNPTIQCPSPSAIKAIILIEDIIHLPNGGWVTIFEPRKYDTDDRWIFTLSNYEADSKQEAYDKTVKSLSTLSFVSGPENEVGSKLCKYETFEGYSGVATKQPF